MTLWSNEAVMIALHSAMEASATKKAFFIVLNQTFCPSESYSSCINAAVLTCNSSFSQKNYLRSSELQRLHSASAYNALTCVKSNVTVWMTIIQSKRQSLHA